MKNIIKLAALAVLLVSCKGMYGDKGSYKTKAKADTKNVEKHVTDHVGNVVRTEAARSSATTEAARSAGIAK